MSLWTPPTLFFTDLFLAIGTLMLAFGILYIIVQMIRK